jgi:hypothetical protein
MEETAQIIRKEYPWLCKAMIQSDNGPNYHSTGFVQAAWFVLRQQGFRLIKMWNNAPGHDNGSTDRCFAVIKGRARLNQRSRLDIGNPLACIWLAAQCVLQLALTASMKF